MRTAAFIALVLALFVSGTAALSSCELNRKPEKPAPSTDDAGDADAGDADAGMKGPR